MPKLLKPFSISEVARATGLTEVNLRAWERRYGFPTPERVASGHRRYSSGDIDRILRVTDERGRGIGLHTAIDRAREHKVEVPSFFATLRDRRPDLQTMTMRKRHLLSLCRAVEDEGLARAERGVLIGSFQRERFYRQSEKRWRALSRGAAVALAFADFDRHRSPPGGPVEVSLARSHPLLNEWALIALAPEHVACLVAWESPGQQLSGDSTREFEVIFTLEPEVAREVAEVGLGIAESLLPEVALNARKRVAEMVEPTPTSQLRLATDITARLVAQLR